MNKYKYEMPKRKQSLITDKFLNIFKEELIKTFKIKEELTWKNHVSNWSSTCGWYNSFKNACSKCGSNGKGLYRYWQRLEPCRWDNQYDSDLFDYELGLMLLDKGLISEGKEINWEQIFKNDSDCRLIKTKKQYKGYTVITEEWE